jgi:hypothetical protein
VKCERPIWIEETSDTKGTYVACGRCYSCIQTKRSVWTFRLLMELRVAESAYFVTLTYDPLNVPYVTNEETGVIYETLKKSHLRKFIKALRQKIYRDYISDVDSPKIELSEEARRWLKKSEKSGKWSAKVRYFAVGEYGGRGDRPHYHIILYNMPLDYVDYDYVRKVDFSEVLEETWKKGMVHLGKVEQGSAHYMTKYHLFPLTEFWSPEDIREKPFAWMSKKPGIGLNWIDGEIVNYYSSNKNSYAVIKNGSKLPIGRYLREKLHEAIEDPEVIREMQRRIAELSDEEEKWLGASYADAFDILERERKHISNNRKKAKRQYLKNNKL